MVLEVNHFSSKRVANCKGVCQLSVNVQPNSFESYNKDCGCQKLISSAWLCDFRKSSAYWFVELTKGQVEIVVERCRWLLIVSISKDVFSCVSKPKARLYALLLYACSGSGYRFFLQPKKLQNARPHLALIQSSCAIILPFWEKGKHGKIRLRTPYAFRFRHVLLLLWLKAECKWMIRCRGKRGQGLGRMM